MTTTAPLKRLRPVDARRLHELDVEVARAKRALAEAKERREEAGFARIRHLLEDGVPVTVGRIEIKRTVKTTGRTFRLAEYLKKHGKPSAEMKPFIGAPTSYERWTIKDISQETAES